MVFAKAENSASIIKQPKTVICESIVRWSHTKLVNMLPVISAKHYHHTTKSEDHYEAKPH